MKFAERLQQERTKKGVTQNEMAKLLGVKLRAYQYYESGKHNPTFDALVVLADYFDVTTDYLLGRTDNPK